jgi:Na+-driven multidrug efflux pump
MHSLSAIAVISGIICFIGLRFTGRISSLLGANDVYFNYVYDYLFWYTLFLIPIQIDSVLMGFCRNDGSPRIVAAAAVVSTVVNIFLDWLFIFPMRKGLAGAAVATGIAQTIALCIVLTHFIRKKGVLRIKAFTPEFALWRKIAMRGLPEMVAQFSTPVTTICMNYALITGLGSDGINAFSIISYAASFSVIVFFGVSEGLQPLFGQSYGARNEKDLRYYFRAGVVINFAASVIMFVLLLFTGGAIANLFGADKAASDVIVSAMPKYTWGFLVISLTTMISAYLYSTKRTKEAVIISVCRGLLFNSLIISLFPVLFGVAIVWFTEGIAETLALIVAIILLKHSEKGGIAFK